MPLVNLGSHPEFALVLVLNSEHRERRDSRTRKEWTRALSRNQTARSRQALAIAAAACGPAFVPIRDRLQAGLAQSA